MKKSEITITALCAFFMGVVVGFLLSPVKKGIEIGNNSGNMTYSNLGDDLPLEDITE